MANVDSNACAKEYTSDIFAHLQDVEKRYMPDARYMETVQSDVNSAMRASLWTGLSGRRRVQAVLGNTISDGCICR